MHFTVLENYHYLTRRKIGIKQCWSSCAKLKPTKSLVNKKVDFHNPVGDGGAGVHLHLNRYSLVKMHVETLETSSKQLQNMRLFQKFVTARQCAFFMKLRWSKKKSDNIDFFPCFFYLIKNIARLVSNVSVSSELPSTFQ